MTVISKEAAGVVLINVFTVEPAGQQPLMRHLSQETESVMRHRPGFVSANVHRSLDGTRVANYAQWRSRADFDAMRQYPPALVLMNEARNMAAVEGTLYELAYSVKAADEVRIHPGAVPLTLIVVMRCEPAEQDELLQYLIRTASEHGEFPGFVSCNLHRSLDGSRITEYIQWHDADALAGMARLPESQAHFARVRPRSSSGQYEVTETFGGSAG
jgi:quinol monooxygenase YgiN